jgi:FixJ family two-component response regulator
VLDLDRCIAVSGFFWPTDDTRRCANSSADGAEIGKVHVSKVPMISIVDDDESVRETTSSLVRSLGLNASAFASAEEFLLSDKLSDTACLITDVQMQGMTGVELQSLLLAQGRHMPIIFMTAFPEERIRKNVLNAGAVGFLSKPFDEECLIQCLDRALGNQGLCC